MKYLRQSTASNIVVGPFVTKADGFTPVTNLAAASTLNGRAISNGIGVVYTPSTFVHDGNGYYVVPLAVGDLPTVGRFRLDFSDPTTYCPVWEDFSVLSQAVYDSMFGSVALQTTAVAVLLPANPPNGFLVTSSFAGGATIPRVTLTDTLTTNSDKLGYGLTTAPPTTAAITTAVVAGMSTSPVGSVAGGVVVTTNNDKAGYSLSQAFPSNFSILGISAAGKINEVILTDNLTTYTGNAVQTGDAFARLGAPIGASIAADVQTRAASTQVPASFTSATFVSPGVFSTSSLANAPAVSVPTTSAITTAVVAGMATAPVGSVTGAVASVTAPVTAGTITDKNGYGLSAAERDAIANDILDLANSIESGETVRQTVRLLRSVILGVAADSGGIAIFKRKDGTTTALTVIHDTAGNRPSSTPGNV